MSNKKNFDDTTEERFLKNKAKRKKHAESSIIRRKKTNSGKPFKIIGIILAAILAAIILAAAGLLIYYFSLDSDVDINKGMTSGDTKTEERAKSDDEKKDDVKKYEHYTFLATATDNSGSLTDVIMVAKFHYNTENPSVSVLQIPRDTYVKVSSKIHLNDDGTLSAKNFDASSANYGTKLNGVSAHGRSLASGDISSLLKKASDKTDKEIDALCHDKQYKYLNVDVSKVQKYARSNSASEKKTIENNIKKDFGITYLSTLIYHYFGIPIDYQAQVNLAGFKGIVNAIGGVDLTVPQRMYYVDPYQDLYIDLYPGYQHLNGKKAEEFVRFRNYVRGDVDRLEAQKIFINAFLDKLLSPSIVVKIDDIISEVQNNLYSGISFNDLLRFSKKILTMNISEDIKMHTLPGVGDYIGDVSYFIAYKDDAIKLINEEFNVYSKDIEEQNFKMIDYNDVISKEKPAISQVTGPIALPLDSPEEKDNEENTEPDDDSQSDDSEKASENDGDEITDNSDKTDDEENSENSDEEASEDENNKSESDVKENDGEESANENTSEKNESQNDNHDDEASENADKTQSDETSADDENNSDISNDESETNHDTNEPENKNQVSNPDSNKNNSPQQMPDINIPILDL